ncbi:MAG: hypothetical protein IJR90_03630 [Clostridia bacterium]|nr:hypothetical protein [Clostridia bacterium]
MTDGDERKLQKAAVYDGTVIARAEIGVPETGCERADGFYAETADLLLRWFEDKVVPAAERDYDRSDDERKRWRYRPFTLVSRVRTEDEGGRLTVTQTVSLTSGANISAETRTAVWRRSDGKLLKISSKHPPERVKKTSRSLT